MRRTMIVAGVAGAVMSALAASPARAGATNRVTFANWQAEYFGTLELLDPATCASTADPDHDGMANVLEYALASNPTLPDRRGLAGVTAGPNSMSLTYTRIAQPDDLVFAPEVSSNLVSWGGGKVLAANTSDPVGDGLVRSVSETLTVSGTAPSGFARLSVEWIGRPWKSEILCRRNSDGGVYLRLIEGTNDLGTATLLSSVASHWVLEARADLDGNGQRDLIWRDVSTGFMSYWLLNGSNYDVAFDTNTIVYASHWSVAGTGDLTGDGHEDILWRQVNDNHGLYLWTMNGGVRVAADTIVAALSSNWRVKTGWFDADSRKDLLLHNPSTGDVIIGLMDGATMVTNSLVMTGVGDAWTVECTGDFNGDGCDDILWRNTSGDVYIWFMNGMTLQEVVPVPTTLALHWAIESVSDFNGDHKADLLLRNTSTGDTYIWIMDGATIAAWSSLGVMSTVNWTIVP